MYVTANLSSPPSSQSDIDDGEVPSVLASHLRNRILSSALRIKQGRKGRKRTTTIFTSPPTRYHFELVWPGYDLNSTMLADEDDKPFTRIARPVERTSLNRLKAQEGILPICPSGLNMTVTGHKRTSPEAFFDSTEEPPAKKILAMTQGGKASVSVAAENALITRVIYPASTLAGVGSSLFLKAQSTPTQISEMMRQEPPMEPFMDPFPLPTMLTMATPTGPFTQFLAISFRVEAALRYVSSIFSSRSTTPFYGVKSFEPSTPALLNLQIFAVVDATEKNGVRNTISLADLFFPDRPPYLTGTIGPHTTSQTLDPASYMTLPKGTFVRVIVSISLTQVSNGLAASGRSAPLMPLPNPGVNTPMPGRDTYNISILNINCSNWDEVQLMKRILDSKPGAVPSSPPVVPPSISTGSGLASVRSNEFDLSPMALRSNQG
ncbi:hypothetical protein AYO20_02176 [Fonsecaea nubica]|uniref:Uncharacterized protein n=1 Tax=Fonsecaea nubica TaxID=856822 RepID=A0A178DA45_9EURO|nr:hypothetical protein AYO20_02176 [Fonsecaea nubica]OAL38527.1 hypothetical protein AYO20_02176 [Fonsecaea nubica]